MIVGCGQIGALYDSIDKKEVLTHAHSFSQSSQIEEFVLVDNDLKNLNKAATLWGVKGFNSIRSAIESGFIPEIACVATPPQSHLQVIQELIEAGVRRIILEKPVALSIDDAIQIENLVKQNDIILNVNYPRRFDRSMFELAEVINNGKFGKLETVRCLYTKGILNGGSHLINLFLFLLGDYKEGRVLNYLDDYSKEDPTISCHLKLSCCDDVYLTATNSKNYFLTEYEFIFEKSRLSYYDRGFQYRREEVRNDPVFPGYFDLEFIKTERTKLDNYLKVLLEDTLTNNTSDTVISTISDANKSMRICLDLISSIRE